MITSNEAKELMNSSQKKIGTELDDIEVLIKDLAGAGERKAYYIFKREISEKAIKSVVEELNKHGYGVEQTNPQSVTIYWDN